MRPPVFNDLLRLLFTGALLSACAIAEGPPSPDFSTPACLIPQAPESEPFELRLALADTLPERQRGLQNLSLLEQNQGMLFRYTQDQPDDFRFWMYRVSIPLDIAFMDASGRLLETFTMAPCEGPKSACPRYPSGVAFRQALELPGGFFEINPGYRQSTLILEACQRN